MISAFSRVIEARPHTAVYTMHKYFARRPWNVFRELISHYSSAGEIVLDPFCGGGVTVIESLKLRRRAIGIDVNPLATYVTEMESRTLNVEPFQEAFSQVSKRARQEISSLYSTKCANCNSRAFADWIEWNEQAQQILRLKYDCHKCRSSREKRPTKGDIKLAQTVGDSLTAEVEQRGLWFPRTRIAPGDKTNSLLKQNVNFFYELFTKRNLLALSILLGEIERVENAEAREFLRFAFSSCLKWASRQSHLRGGIVEGWAMHAYWVYPKSLEINVWNTFERRINAITRGKRYSNHYIGDFCSIGETFRDLVNGSASCLVLNRSSAKLPIPDNSIDAVITDPPYGGNVNYAELSDFWHIWLSKGMTIDKEAEVVINKTQRKKLEDYERLLYAVFRECYRILKPHRYLISTFNSKDMRVVGSFITAASEAGFTLHPDGVLYQNPIRPYTTTFHAMQIGAFVGDFIFTFIKKERPQTQSRRVEHELTNIKEDLMRLITETVRGGITEPQVRERAYRLLIPFLAKFARVNTPKCREAVDFFEAKMSELDLYFKDLRKTVTERRRRVFQSRRG